MKKEEANNLKNKMIEYNLSKFNKQRFNLTDEQAGELELVFSISFGIIIDGFTEKKGDE